MSIYFKPYRSQPLAFLPSDPEVMGVAEEVATALRELLAGDEIAIEHVGSTSVPGLAGKNSINLVVAAPRADFLEVLALLEGLGLRVHPERPEPASRPVRLGTVHKQGREYLVHVKVVAHNSPDHFQQVLFRDYLREHPEAVTAYAELKRQLVEAGATEHEYSHAKQPFIRDIIERAKGSLPEDATLVFRGIIFDVYQWQQQLYDGSLATFEKLRRPDTALVVPVTDQGTLLMVREVQPGKAVAYGFPGGRVEPGEEPKTAAARELEEETGYQAELLRPFLVDRPLNKIEWSVHVFIGLGCVKTTDQHQDAGERIQLLKMSLDEVLGLARDGVLQPSLLTDYLLRAQLDSELMLQLKRSLNLA